MTQWTVDWTLVQSTVYSTPPFFSLLFPLSFLYHLLPSLTVYIDDIDLFRIVISTEWCGLVKGIIGTYLLQITNILTWSAINGQYHCWCGEPGGRDGSLNSLVTTYHLTYLAPLIFIDLFLNTRGVSHSSYWWPG